MIKRQMGVAISEKMRKKLQIASEAGGHSLAEEIRRRVEQSFEAEIEINRLREQVKMLELLTQTLVQAALATTHE
jgi:hypothetical protein